MEENKWIMSWNSFKIDLTAWKLKQEKDEKHLNRTYKSKFSNSSSLFSDDEEDVKQNDLNEGKIVRYCLHIIQ